MSDFITNAELRIEAERLCDENEKLQAENAKLRDKFRKMDEWHSKELVAAMDENDRLRELVRISIEYCNSGTCDECPIQGDDGSCPYAEMALKLGVEAPE